MEQNKLVVPLAIIIAGTLIAGAVYFGGKNEIPTNAPKAKTEINIKNVDPSKDHILGNPDAVLTMVTYSDTECPYCKDFHDTTSKIVSEFGTKGELAVVFRHFPIHEKSSKEAEASECAAEIGGDSKFWEYMNQIFSKKLGAKELQARAKPNGGINLSDLPILAEQIGLDKNKFAECLNSGKYTNEVKSQYDDLLNSGYPKEEIGTPFNVFITKNGKKIAVPGALPYEMMKTTISSILESN